MTWLAALGVALFLVSAGIFTTLLLGWWNERIPSQSPGETLTVTTGLGSRTIDIPQPSSSLEARLQEDVRRRQARLKLNMQWLGGTLFLLSVFLLILPSVFAPPPETRPISVSAPPVAAGQPGSTPAASPPRTATSGQDTAPQTTAGAITRLWPVLGVAGLAVLVGGVLLLIGNLWAKVAGAVALASGLAMHWNATFDIENLLNIDVGKVQLLGDLKGEIKAELPTDIEIQIRKMGLGAQHMGQFTEFDPGKSDLKENMQELTSSVCAQWNDHIAKGQEGLLLVIGATDRVPLSPSTRLRYESNFGLARARSEQVKSKIVECGVSSPQVIALVSGPQTTPEGASGSPVAAGFPKDRAVDVWAFWSWRGPR